MHPAFISILPLKNLQNKRVCINYKAIEQRYAILNACLFSKTRIGLSSIAQGTGTTHTKSDPRLSSLTSNIN